MPTKPALAVTTCTRSLAPVCAVSPPMLTIAARGERVSSGKDGETGVAHAIQVLREEVDRNMALLGVNRCDEVGSAHVRDIRGATIAAFGRAADLG